MKYLLVVVVVVVVLWLMLRTRKSTMGAPPTARRTRRGGEPDRMVACEHCGLHLPHDDALRDGAGRPYCSDAHRLAGPR